MHPAQPQMTADRSPISEWPEHRSLGGRTIVAEIRSGKGRSMLELGMSPHSMSRLERIIRPINGLCQRKRRKLLLLVKCAERLLIAHAVIDAKINVARIDARQLIRVIRANRRALCDL